MAGFFESSGGDNGGGTIDPSLLATILDAKDQAVAAKASADAAVSAAQQAASQAQTALNNIPDISSLQQQVQLAKDYASKVGGDVEPGIKSAKAYAGDALSSVSDAQNVVSQVQTVAASATASAALADAFANAPPGTEVAEGKFSAAHYQQQIVQAAASVAKIPKKEIRDADLSAGAYTLLQSDLNKYLVALTTVATSIVLPAGLSTTPGPSGVPAVGFVHVVRRGSGSVSFAAGSGGGGLPSSVLTDQYFTFGQTAGGGVGVNKAFSHTLSVPAGNKRRIAALLFAITDVGGSGGATAATATNTTAFTKTLADTSDGYFSGSAPLAAQWVGTLADSATATSVTVSGTIGNCLTYAIWLVAFKDTSGTTASSGASSATAATSQAQTLTPLEAGSVNVFGLAIAGADALPLTMSGGSPTTTGSNKTPGARTAKDFAFVFGYEARTNTTAVTYTATTAKTTGVGARQGLVVRPDTAASSVVITGGGTPTLSAVGKHANIYVDTDGVTYDVETN